MDGKNSSGRKISLLNDSSDVGPLFAKAQHHPLPPLAAQVHSHHQPQTSYFANASHSRASSCASTPSLSPQTPQLVRSSSSDSRNTATPSPSTPLSAGLHDYQHSQQQYYFHNHRGVTKMDDVNGSMYPPPDTTVSMPSAYPIPSHISTQIAPPQGTQQIYRSSNSPSSEPSRVSTVSTASNTARPLAPKKNQYPCPLSKQFGCNDYFTTSGHAARHAKKHTGKKDAFCPECNKAFTRKDNMEQHRRTHQNGRGSSRTKAGSEDSKVKKPSKSAEKKTSVKSEPALEAAVEQQMAEQQQQQMHAQVQAVQMQNARQQAQQQTTDPTMMIPPVGSGPYFLNSIDSGPIPPLPMPTMTDPSMRPTLHRSNFTSSLDYYPPGQVMGDPEMNFSYPSPGLSNGLNSLALAASEHRRLSEEKSRSPSDEGSTP